MKKNYDIVYVVYNEFDATSELFKTLEVAKKYRDVCIFSKEGYMPTTKKQTKYLIKEYRGDIYIDKRKVWKS